MHIQFENTIVSNALTSVTERSVMFLCIGVTWGARGVGKCLSNIFYTTQYFFWLLLSRKGRLKNRNIFKKIPEWYKTKNEKPTF